MAPVTGKAGERMAAQDKELSKVTKLYRELVERIDEGRTENIGVRLCEVLPMWERELFEKWKDGLMPIYDKNELHDNDEAAIDFVLTLPYHLRKMAFLCGSNGAIQHAKNLMQLRELLIAVLKQVGIVDIKE